VRTTVRDHWYNTGEIKDTKPFNATMQIQNCVVAGSSVKRLVIQDINTFKEYPLFVKDLLDIINKVGVREGGFVTGRWKVKKRGTSYGLALMTDD